MKNKNESNKTIGAILIGVGFLAIFIPSSPAYPIFLTWLPVELIYTLCAISIISGIVIAKYG